MDPQQENVTLEQLRDMLSAILTTLDNNVRRNAEICVVRALRSPQTAIHLVNLVRDLSTTPAGVRHLSAILLRKKLFSLWRTLPLEQHSEFKTIMLTQLGLEPSKMVRFAVAHVVSILAKAEARDGNGWPELQSAIYGAMQSESMEMRELSMVLAYSIAEVFGDQPGFIDGIGQAVISGLNDSAVSVRLAALKAVSVILPFLHGHKLAKEQLHAAIVPRVITIIKENLGNPDMLNLVLRTMELVEQLCEDLHTNTHGAYLLELFQFLINILCSRETAHLRVREHASEVLSMLVQTKPKFIIKNDLTNVLVQSCLQVMGEDETISLPFEYDEELDELDDEDVELLQVRTACMFSAKLLNLCCSHLSAKTVTQSCMALVTSILENPAAPPLQRKAAIIGLACLAEGNPGYLRRRVSTILNAVDSLLHDASTVPREAAAFALIYFSDHLQPEILTHHSRLLPMLMQMLEDPHDNVRHRVAETLDKLCENIAENLDPYIPQLMPLILHAIPSSMTLTQESLISTISSIAQTQCPAFNAFGEQVLTLLREPMSLDIKHPSMLRAKATEAVGIVSLAMGRERFQPFFDFFMARVVENLNAQRAELREQSFGFLANMCEMLRESFTPFIDDTVAAAIASLDRDTSHVENKHLLAQAANIDLDLDVDAEKEHGDGGEESEEDDDANEIHIRVRTADVEEKSSAVYVMGVLAEILTSEHLGMARLQMCWKALLGVSGHFHPNVRCNAMEALAKIAIAAHGNQPVSKQAAAASVDTLNPQVRAIINELLYEVLYPCLAGETEKEVVAAASEALVKLITFYGSQTFSTDISDLCAVIATLLRQESPCQTTDEDIVDSDDDDGNENAGGLSEDHDHVLMDAVCDIIDTLAAAFGADFEPYFRELAVDLLPYLAEGRPAEDFTMAAGVMANCFMSMGPVSAAYFEQAISLALRIIYETDESAAKANCCFIIRALIEHCASQISNGQQLNDILKALWNVAGSHDEIPQACDNAISATCSVVIHLSHLVPLDVVVPTLLKQIPMKVDKAENRNALTCLQFLLTQQEAFVATHTGSVAECCAKFLLDRSVDATLKQELSRTLQMVSVSPVVGPAFAVAMPTLHPQFQRILTSAVSGGQ